LTGWDQRPRETQRAPDPKEINMPAGNQKRIGGAEGLALCGWHA
jgi:hypothetical protein